MTEQSNEAVQNIASVYAETTGTATFNNVHITGNVNFTQFKGIIVAWSGATSAIPAGWGFCDGTAYTALDGTKLQSPDLRSKFILGASSPGTPTNNVEPTAENRGTPNYPGLWLTPRQVADQGGEENHTLSIAEMPTHSHGYTSPDAGGRNFCYGAGCNLYLSQDNGAQTAQVGGNGAHNNMPPFFALAYIIKL